MLHASLTKQYRREPLFSAPLDMILLLVVLPTHYRRLRLKLFFRSAVKVWWTALATWLRLSSYFEGVRYSDRQQAGRIEQKLLDAHRLVVTGVRFLLRSKKPLPSYEGMEMRVPYSDSVVLVKPRRAVFISVDPLGIPLTDEGKITAVYQDRVAQKVNRRSRDDYCQVYLPPLYPLRFWIFGILLWTGVSCGLALAFFLPVMVGRLAFKLASPYQFHDGYSFVSRSES